MTSYVLLLTLVLNSLYHLLLTSPEDQPVKPVYDTGQDN